MNDKIFGYDWDDIKCAQQGNMSGLRRFRVSSAPGGDWTEADKIICLGALILWKHLIYFLHGWDGPSHN